LIHVWSVPAGKLVGVMEGHVTDVNPIAFLPDGKTIVSVADHESVRFWNVATRREMLSFPHQSNFPRQILVSLDGISLAVTSDLNSAAKVGCNGMLPPGMQSHLKTSP
jgi:WD40 repeat protein